jgi:hypothetical protein
MTARDVLYVQGDGVSPNQTAVEDRSWLGAILAGNVFDSVTAGIGARGRSHGILSADALAVTSTGASDKGVVAARGMASVRGTFAGQSGCYICANDANVTLTLADRAAATNTRRDLIVAQVRDAQYSGASNDWQLAIVQGAPAVSPVDPTVPASSLVLARVTIPPGANPFNTTGMITDLRPHARAAGGIVPAQTTADFPNPEDFDFVWEISTGVLKMRIAGAWVEVGRDLDTNWTSLTPNWNGSFTVGSGNQYLRYVRYGSTITGIAGFVWGAGSSMSGNLRLDLVASGLPAVKNPGASGRYLAGGRMFDASGVDFWSVGADINPTTGRIENFATQGNAVWSPTQPVTWALNDTLRIAFNYEVA